MFKQAIKQMMGSVMIPLANALPALRPGLASMGPRLGNAVWRGREAVLITPANKPVKVGSVEKSYMSLEVFWKGWTYYEPCTSVLWEGLACRAGLIIDVGANMGWFSLIASKVKMPDAKVVACEANQTLVEIIRANSKRNGGIFEVVDKAISDHCGEATWYQSRSDMSGTLAEGFNRHIEEQSKVQVTTLDALCRGLGARPNLVKIDVEGHEPAVFRGGTEVLADESCDVIFETTQEILQGEALSPLGGKRLFHITDAGLVPCRRVDYLCKDGLYFLNILATAKSDGEIRGLSDDIVRRTKHIDFRKTTKARSSPPRTA